MTRQMGINLGSMKYMNVVFESLAFTELTIFVDIFLQIKLHAKIYTIEPSSDVDLIKSGRKMLVGEHLALQLCIITLFEVILKFLL